VVLETFSLNGPKEQHVVAGITYSFLMQLVCWCSPDCAESYISSLHGPIF
jgi:hypothetical protein